MLSLHPNETVLMTIRRHWFVLLAPSFMIFILLLLPLAVLSLIPLAFPDAELELGALGNFILSLYLMFLLLFAFLIWMNYYLDVWIITTERIIDIEQHNLFSRTISEFPMSRVQDVSIDVHGVIETFLKFGDLKVQTAGSHEGFVINDAPDLYRAKDAILKQAMRAHALSKEVL